MNELIRNQEGVRAVADALAEEALFAADTEAAGYHRYHDRVCLLQISTRDATFIIDTLAVTHLDEEGYQELLAQRRAAAGRPAADQQ